MVFQDPFGSINPRFSIGRTVEEPLLIHDLGDAAERRQRAIAALEDAELRPGAVDRSRQEKPQIPRTGDYGIPLHDEIDLTLRV